ncbi:MAG: SIR2 family protein [Thermoanaerobaculia bacterium]
MNAVKYSAASKGVSNTNAGGLYESRVVPIAPRRLSWSHRADPVRYAVITLNYDTVLEDVADAINATNGTSFGFRRTGPAGRDNDPCLVKLHGSVHDKSIVPPTWNKALHPDIKSAWQVAYDLLREATQICIIGYSLPITDAYVHYLFKAAFVEARHLKSTSTSSRSIPQARRRRV